MRFRERALTPGTNSPFRSLTLRATATPLSNAAIEPLGGQQLQRLVTVPSR